MTAKATCRSCGAPVTWVRTETNRVMPIDRHPTEAGNIAMIGRTDVKGRPVVAVWPTAGAAVAAGYTVRFVSHFSTCPDADSWRGKR